MAVDQEALCDLLEVGLLVTQGRPPEHCCAGRHVFFSPRRTDRAQGYSVPWIEVPNRAALLPVAPVRRSPWSRLRRVEDETAFGDETQVPDLLERTAVSELIQRGEAERLPDPRSALGLGDTECEATQRTCALIGCRDREDERPGPQHASPAVVAVQVNVSPHLVREGVLALRRAVGLDERAGSPAVPFQRHERVGEDCRASELMDDLPVRLPGEVDVTRARGAVAERERDVRERDRVVEKHDAGSAAAPRSGAVVGGVRALARSRQDVCPRRAGGGYGAGQHDRLDESALAKLAEDAEGRDPAGWGSHGRAREEERL